MTLVEVMVSMMLMSFVTVAVLGAFVQSRRANEFQKNKALVDTFVQGVLDQIRNRRAASFPANPDATLVDRFAPLASMTALTTYISGGNAAPYIAVELNTDTAVEQLQLSPLPIMDPTMISLTAVRDLPAISGFRNMDGDPGLTNDAWVNTYLIDVKGTTGKEGSPNITTDDIQVNIMVWLDNSVTQSNVAQGGSTTTLARGIHIVYAWTYRDGQTIRPVVGKTYAICRPRNE
jgi:type II secretory pathway pseudopilin PulG